MNSREYESINPAEQAEQQAEIRQDGPHDPQKNVRPAPQRVRRVGSFTLGVALILTGGCIALSMVRPDFPILTAARLAPLVLVALGVEVLWANARKGDARLKYDLLSMFVCFVLICASLGAATLPLLLRFYGPEREYTEQRLERELEQKLYETLPAGSVQDGYSYVDLRRVEFDEDMTLAELKAEDRVEVNLTLSGEYADENAFAQACAQLLPALRDLGVNQVNFSAENTEDRWTLEIGGPFQMNSDAGQLAGQVTHEVRYAADDQDSWWDPDELNAYLAERAQQAQQEDQMEDETQAPTVEEGETEEIVTEEAA